MNSQLKQKNILIYISKYKTLIFLGVFVFFGAIFMFGPRLWQDSQSKVLALLPQASRVEAAVRTWTGATNGSWSNAGNWGGTAPVTGDDLVFPGGASNLSNTNDLTENTIINSITLSGSGYTLSGNKLILGAGLAGITDSAASGGNTIALDIRLDATRDIYVTNTAESLTISGRIDGVGGINKEGTGTLILSGGNTYGGITKINVGVINARHSTALGTIAAGTEVVGNAALELQGGISISYEALALRGFGVSSAGALRNISENNTYGGLITMIAGGAEIASDSGTLTLTGGMTGAFPLVIDGAGDVTYSTTPIATGAGTVTKNGAGILTYNFPNTYTGLTTINAGTLRYGVDNALLSGAITVTGGTLDIVTFSDMVGTVTLGTLGLASGTITGTSGLLSSSTWTVYNGTISAIIGGDGGALTKTTPGTVILTRPNLYTGATTVSAGILEIQDSTSLGLIDGITTVSAGATLEINGDALTVPEYITFSGTGHLYSGAIRNQTGNNVLTGLLTLAAAGMIKSDVSTTLTVDTKGLSVTTLGLTIAGEGNTTFTSTAPIYGTTATLTKNDNGTLNIQSFSNFTGTTTINRGTLTLSVAGALPSSAVTVNTGGTYTVDNSVGAALNRMSETAALTMNGGNFNFVGNGTVSTSESTGALTLSSGHNIVTVTPGAGGSTTMTFASLTRTAGASVLFRGTSLGSNPAPNVSTLMFTSAPAVLGASGAAGTTTASVIKGAFGDNSLSGTGTDMVVYNLGNTNGLRLLNGAGFSGEYSTTLTTNTNVKLTADVAASTVSINSLILNGFGITNPGGAVTTTISSGSLAGNILANSATSIAGANTTLGIGTTELNIHATANSTITAIIGTAAAGSLTLSGTGNVTLSAASAYTGTTTINRATLTYGASNVLSSGGVTVGNGTLDIATFSDTVGAVILQNGIITGSSGVLSGTSYSFREGTVSAIIAGGAAVVTRVATNTAPDSVVTMTRENTYTGATTITSGILKLGAAGNGTNTPLGTTGGATTVANIAALDLNGYTLSTTEGLSLAGLGYGPGSSVANGNSNMGALMNSVGTPVTYNGAITLTAAARINADAGALTIGGTISGATIGLTIGGYSDSTFNGVIGTTSGTLTKDGIGVLTLAASNTYTGLTTISVGTIKLGATGGGTNTPLGTTGAGTTVTTGARLDLNGYTLGTAEGLTLNGVGYGLGDFASGALINSSGSSVSYSGAITLGSTGVLVKADSGNITLSGNVGGNTFALTVGGTGTGTMSGVIGTTSGTVTKIGTGTWTLSGANSFTGVATIANGTLKLGATGGATNTPLGTTGSGTSVLSGAVLDLNGFTLANTTTFEALTINGRGISDGGALVNNSGSATGYSGTITQATDSRITNSGAGLLTLSNTVSGAFALYIGGAGNITTSVLIPASALSITKQGAGTLTVTGANAYTGETRVDAGTFAYAGTTTLVGTNLVMKGGTFNSGANADTIGAVTLIGGVITNSAALTGTAYTFESGTISGILAGAIAVVKNTNNTVILSGVNTISSTATINAGTLQISGSGSAVSVTAITVNLGGTLTLDNTSTAVASRILDTLVLTMNGGNFNFIGNTAGASSETIGQLAFASGHNIVTVTPGAGGSTTLTVANNPGFNRTAGATVLFRGTSFGSAAAANVSTLLFSTAPTLTGAGGAANSTTASVIKGAFGDSSLSGTGSDMVTYNLGNTNGLRLLNGAGFAGEYSATLTTNTNVKLTGNVAASTVSINSLILNGFGVTNPGGAVTTTISSGSLSGNILINSANDIAGANTTLGITTTELTVLATANSTISAIVGTATTGSLTLSGSGNVTMSAANPYTSTTFINNATLTYGASNVLSSGGVTMRGGLYNLNGNSDTIGALTLTAGTVTTGAGTITLGSDLTTIANGNAASLVTGNLGLGANRIFNIGDGLMDNDAIISAVISGGFTVTKSTGAGVLVFSNSNTYTGATTISAGILRLGTAGGGTNTPLGTTAAGTTVSGASSALDLNGYTLGTAEALTLSGALATGALQNTSSTAVNYSGLITLGAASTIMSNYGDINITNTGNITGTGFLLTIGGAGNGSLDSNLNTSTAGALTKNGFGVWTVSGASNYTGATTISVGTLKLSGAGSGSNTPLGTTAGTTTITSGAILDLNGFTLTTAEPLAINGTGIASIGAFINSSNNSLSYSGVITPGATSRLANYGSGLLTLTGNIVGSTRTITFVTVGDITQSSASVWSGTSTSLIKEGSGTLILAGQNSFTTGTVTVSTGKLQLGADGGATNTPLGTSGAGTTVSAGAVLDLSTFTLGGASTYEPLTIAGSGILNGGALISNAASGNTNFGATANTSSRIVNNGAAGTLTIVGALTGASSFWVGGTGNTIISGQINQTAILITKYGAGTLTLSNATNTVTSLVRINEGTLAYGVADALVTGPVTVAGGTLNLNGFNETNIGAVTLIDGSIVNTGGAATLTSTATYTLENGTISAVLGGAVVAAIAKNTAGRVILSGDNSFNGTAATIAVNAGFLNLRHNNALGAAASANTTTISGGATLELENSITIPAPKAITVNGTGVAKVGAIRSVNGSNTISANITLGTTNVRINSDAGSLTIPSVSGNTFNTIFGGAGSITVSGAIGTTSGSVTKDGAGSLSLPGNNTYTGPTTIILGTIIANSTASIGNGSATNTLILNGGTLQATGTITSGATRTVTLGYDGGTLDTNGNAISIAGTIGYVGGLTKAGPGTLTVTGTTTVGRNFTISNGTFVAPTTMTINGDFSNSGVFTHNSGTVTMTPTTSNTTASILGTSDTVFNNFTNTTPGSTLKFKEGNTYTFSGALTITGVDGNPVSMVSVTPASQWNMVINTYSLTWLNIQDSNCSGATGVNDGNATIVGIGGNSGVCWTFVEITLGAGGDASEGGAGSGGAGAGGGGAGAGGGGSGGGAGSGGAGGGGAGSITEVGSGSQRATYVGGGGTQPLAFPGSVTTGNLLIVAGATYSDGAPPNDVTVNDSIGTSYTTINSVDGNGKNWIAYGIAGSSGANTVTVVMGSYGTFSIDEFSGVDSTPLDVNGSYSTGVGTSVSDGITTGVNNALIIGVMAHYTGGSFTMTPEGSWTQIGEEENNSSYQVHNTMFRIAGAAGAYTADWTLSSSSSWLAQSASFKPGGGSSGAGGGGGGSPQSCSVVVQQRNKDSENRYCQNQQCQTQKQKQN